MNATNVLEQVQKSPQAVKAQVLAELLREAFVGTGGGPVPVSDGCGGVLGYVLKPSPTGSAPPELTAEEWDQVCRAADDWDAGVPLDEFMTRVDREIEKRAAGSAPASGSK
jgi:hypothetical protein